MDTDQEKRGILKGSRLFKNFSSEIIDAIVPLLTTCRFDADNVIFMKGEESECLYIIHEGEAEISVSSCEGKEILLCTLGKGDAFGEVGLLDHGPRTANIIAKTDISLYRLSNNDFKNITKLFGINEFTAMTSYICCMFRSVTNNLEEMAFLDASVRVARKVQSLYLQNQGTKDGNSFSVSISQEKLGRMTGLSREAANKALCQLKEMGLLEHTYKCITVPDIEKFQQAIE